MKQQQIDTIHALINEMDQDELAIVVRFCKMIKNTKLITAARVTALMVESEQYKEPYKESCNDTDK